MRKLWEICEKFVIKLWASCEKNVKKCEKVVRKLWESCEKFVRKLWKICGKAVRKLSESLLFYSSFILCSHVCSFLFTPNLPEFRCPPEETRGRGFAFQAKGYGKKCLNKIGFTEDPLPRAPCLKRNRFFFSDGFPYSPTWPLLQVLTDGHNTGTADNWSSANMWGDPSDLQYIDNCDVYCIWRGRRRGGSLLHK